MSLSEGIMQKRVVTEMRGLGEAAEGLLLRRFFLLQRW